VSNETRCSCINSAGVSSCSNTALALLSLSWIETS
jgi:hypothetical protein